MTRRLFAGFLLLVACSREGPTPVEASSHVLTGAGASLPYPLYSQWTARYASVDPRVKINYQALGSGAGRRQVTDGVVDFGASDAPISYHHPPEAGVVLVPTTIGAVVLSYNLAAVTSLRLTPALAADLFLGRVRRWDDERIRTANPGAPLPNEPITIVHRADGSGTTAALTAYLASESAAFEQSVGNGLSVRFPVGVGARGNEGVAAFLRSTPGALGYLELAYARRARLATALIQNKAGVFVEASLASLETQVRDESADGAYPIAALSFVLVPRETRDPGRARALARFLWWAIHDGQALAPSLDYAPLSPELVARGERALRELRAAGRPVLPADG
jgi:phosphate transport system substrate-binding protein